MNMFKKNGGFTLVELIVVIAILAILAAVAVPAYNGYIGKAQDAADTTALAAVKTAAQGALATTGSVNKITVVSDATTGAISAVSAYVGTTEYKLYADSKFNTTDYNDFAMFMNNEMPKLTGGYKGGTATWLAAKDDTAKLAAGWNKPAAKAE